MKKKIYIDIFFFLLFHIYRKNLLPPVLKMCPIPDIPLMVEKIMILSNNKLQVLIFEKIQITDSYLIKFLVNIWNNDKNFQDLRDQNRCKNVGLMNKMAIYHDFHGLKLSFVLFTSKIIL